MKGGYADIYIKSARKMPPFKVAYAQCSKHHWKHHNKWTCDDPWSYDSFLFMNHEEDIGVMGHLATHYIKYTDELKAEIIRLCNADKLDELKELIEENLK